MDATNLTIQSLWIGEVLSPMEIMCIRSYLEHGHRFDLYVYDEIKNIPEGTTVKDAGSIIKREDVKTDLFGGHVNFSNQFRYTMLYKIGGWWVDMDTVCLKRFDFDTDYVFSSENSDPNHRSLVNTTYIKSAPRAGFLKECLDFMDARGYENIHWGELGVNLISRMIFRSGLGEFVRTPDIFCPVSPYRIGDLVKDTGYVLPDSAYALHWWHELWRRTGMNKNGDFPEGSLYQKFNNRYVR